MLVGIGWHSKKAKSQIPNRPHFSGLERHRTDSRVSLSGSRVGAWAVGQLCRAGRPRRGRGPSAPGTLEAGKAPAPRSPRRARAHEAQCAPLECERSFFLTRFAHVRGRGKIELGEKVMHHKTAYSVSDTLERSLQGFAQGFRA